MKKLFLKSLALVAMLLYGLTASAVDWSTIAWAGDGAQGGALNNKYKVATPNGVSLVNIQIPGFATEAGFYITFPDAAFGEFRINGAKTNYAVQGAGVCLYVSNFTAQETEVQVMNADNSSSRWTLYVYYVDGTPAGGGVETIKPVMLSAVVDEESITETSAKVRVEAADSETPFANIRYNVVITRGTIVGNKETMTAENGLLSFSGLESSATYSLQIWALDTDDNESEN